MNRQNQQAGKKVYNSVKLISFLEIGKLCNSRIRLQFAEIHFKNAVSRIDYFGGQFIWYPLVLKLFSNDFDLASSPYKDLP